MDEGKKIVPRCNILRWRMLEEEFVKLRKSGKTLGEIGRLFGFSAASVSRHKFEIMKNTGCGEEFFAKNFYALHADDTDDTESEPKIVHVKIFNDFSFETDDKNEKKILADKEGLDGTIYYLIREESIQDMAVRELCNLAKLLLYVRNTNKEIEYSYRSKDKFDFFLRVKTLFA